MKRLTSASGFDIESVWSPDGKRIAFAKSSQWADGLLHIIDAQSGMPIALPGRAIVRGSTIYYKMEFHPGGRRILSVFQSAGKKIGLGPV